MASDRQCEPFLVLTVKALRARHVHTGVVEWIGVSPARRAPMNAVESVAVEIGTGLIGDRHAARGAGKRQVTLVQAEHLEVIARFLGREVGPELLRRNLVVSGINLHALARARFEVGDVVLEGTGPCAPCSRMEETLGPGGYAACRGHGGITATVVVPGVVVCGAPVSWRANLS